MLNLNAGVELDNELIDPQQEAGKELDKTIFQEVVPGETPELKDGLEIDALVTKQRGLDYMQNNLETIGGVSQQFVLESIHLVPGLVTDQCPLGFYSQDITKTRFNFALEAIAAERQIVTDKLATEGLYYATEGFIQDAINAVKDKFGSKSEALHIGYVNYWSADAIAVLIDKIKTNYGDLNKVKRSVISVKPVKGVNINGLLGTGNKPAKPEEAAGLIHKAMQDAKNVGTLMLKITADYNRAANKLIQDYMKSKGSPDKWEALNQDLKALGSSVKWPELPHEGLYSNYELHLSPEFFKNTDINAGFRGSKTDESRQRDELPVTSLTAEQVVEFSGLMIEGLKFLLEVEQRWNSFIKSHSNTLDQDEDLIHVHLLEYGEDSYIKQVFEGQNRFMFLPTYFENTYRVYFSQFLAALDLWISRSLKS